MRVNLLFGFLGSGKTTLVRRILSERSAKQPMAVIVNEFGEVGVDGDIITGNSVDLVELTSGCLCCTLRGSLMSAVEELRARSRIERIVVEATGVASPGDMLEDLAESNVQDVLNVGPVVTVVDAPKFTRLRDMLGEFYEDQVENADVLVLNKIDLADREQLSAAEDAIRAINPDATVLFAEQGDTDLAMLLDGPTSELFAQIQSDLGHTVDHQHHDHAHAPAESFVVDMDGETDAQSLPGVFAALTDKVWRVKGFIKTSDGWQLLQFTMGQLELTPAQQRPRAYLVVIGHSMPRASIEHALTATIKEPVNGH